MGQRYVLRSAMIAVIALIVGMFDMTKQAHAENSAPDGYAFIDTFADRKATISVYNPLPGFMEELLRLDRKTQYIQQPPNGWQSFTQADIWVFFLNTTKNLDLIGHYSKQIQKLDNFDSITHGSNTSKIIQVTIPDGGSEDSKRRIIIHYFFVSKYDDSLPDLACKTATSLYADLAGWFELARVATVKSCKAGG